MSKVNHSKVNESTVNESTVNESTINKSIVPEIRLLIIDPHCSYCSKGIFQLARDHSICFFCFLAHTAHLFHRRDVEIFEYMSNVYCVELDV